MNETLKAIDHAAQQGPLWITIAFALIIGAASVTVIRRLLSYHEKESDRKDTELQRLIAEHAASREAHHQTLREHAAVMSKMVADQNAMTKEVAVVLNRSVCALEENTQELRRGREERRRIH